MTATNHALSGAILGLVVGQPLVALPLAFLSHFLLDSLPHYGNPKLDVGSRTFKKFLMSDITLCILLAGWITLTQTPGWFWACWAAFLATSPDLMWLPRFLKEQHGLQWHAPNTLLIRFHTFIQWYQRPLGAYVELVWAVICLLTLVKLIYF